MPNTSLIFCGGLAPSNTTLNRVRKISNVNQIIAADSGLHIAQKLNLKVDVVIGDMDSVDADCLALAISDGAKIVRHDRDKDFTDLQSAILHAANEFASQRIIIVTAGGGRLDHQFGVLAAMFHPSLREISVEALWENSHVFAMQGPKTLDITTQIGDIIGLQSFSSRSEQITTTGLRWQLNAESLTNFETRGVSNESTATQVSVSFSSGQLLVVHHERKPK